MGDGEGEGDVKREGGWRRGWVVKWKKEGDGHVTSCSLVRCVMVVCHDHCIMVAVLCFCRIIIVLSWSSFVVSWCRPLSCSHHHHHVLHVVLCSRHVVHVVFMVCCIQRNEDDKQQDHHCRLSSGFHITDSDVAPIMVSEGGLGDRWCVITLAGHHTITIR
jgi:hypothetical protein